MALPVLTLESYPTRSTEPIVFRLVVDANGPLSTIDVVIASLSSSTAAYESGTFQGEYASGSTVTGTGTEGDPYIFTIRPSSGWPLNGTVPHQISLRFGTTTPDAVTFPDGYLDEFYYRLYANPSGNELRANLAATPTIKAIYDAQQVTLCALTQDFVIFLPDLVTLMTNCAALNPPIRVIPGARIWPSTTASYSDVIENDAYIASVVAGFSTLCDMALAAGHNQIYIDAEQYSSHPTLAGAEPSATWLVSNGSSETQFRSHWQALIDLFVTKGVCLVVGQFGKDFDDVATRDDLQALPLFMLDELGPERCEFVTEASFLICEQYRQDAAGSFAAGATRQHTLQSRAETLAQLGTLHWRPMINDDQVQLWGAAWPGSYGQTASVGPAKGIGYDWTRTNHALRGTVAHYNGTAYVGGSPNDCDHVICFSPTANGLQTMRSVGLVGNALLEVYTGTAGALNPAAMRCDDRWGITFNEPPAPNTYTYGRMVGVLPNSASAPYSIDLDGFMIPSGITTDLVIMCHGQSNVLVFQIVYLYPEDKIQVQWGSSGATTLDLLSAPTKDAVHRPQVVRVDGTHYRVGIDSVAMQAVVTPAVVAFTTLQLGGGKDPRSPGTNGNWGRPGLKFRGPISGTVGATVSYLVGQVGIASRAWSDGTDIVNVRAGHYPWGYGS